MKIYNLDIAMFVAGLPFDGNTIPSGKSLGGSETAAVQMAEALAKQGHHVSVFCNCENVVEVEGVLYSPIGWSNNQRGGFPKGFYDYIRSVPIDVCIVQRIPSMFQFETRAKVNLLWQHDLATKTGPSQFQPFAWSLDKILVLSQFMKKQYQEVHGGPDSLYHVTRNGIDLDSINAVPEMPRDRFRMTYTARPERGLDILLQAALPKILEREPRAKLYVSRYQDPNVMEFYAQLENEMKRFGDRVEFLGNLGKKALYENYKQSRLYIYPSMFEEVSCCSGDTLIDAPRDYRKYPDGIPIRDLVGQSNFPVYCYDQTKEQITLGTVKWVAKTKLDAQIWKLTLDDGNVLRATPDHKIMLRDGSYKELQTLVPGESLMPLYKHIRVEVNCNNGEWIHEHRLVGEWKEGRPLDGHNEHVHHKNGWWSNDPDNLEVLSRSEHFRLTHTGRKKSPQQIAKRVKSFAKYVNSDIGKQALTNSGKLRSEKAWKTIRSWSEDQQKEFFAKRAALRDNTNVSESGKKWWANFKALPISEQQEWLKLRSEKIWQSRHENKAEYNHKVVSIEPDGSEDVYDMEVDVHHNFVANGIVIHNCLTAMETSACGCVFLGPWRAAIPETVGGSAPLVRDDGFLAQMEDAAETGLKMPSEAFVNGMVDQAVKLMLDDEYHANWQKRGIKRANEFGWAEVAENWVKLSHDIIAEKSGDDRRLVRHFLFNSDVVAARKYAIEKQDKSLVQSVENYINRYVPFMSNSIPEAQRPTIAQFYESRSGGAQANYSTGFFADNEERLKQLKEFLRPRIESGEIKTLLDFGCAHGGYARSLTDEFPTLKVVGVDNSASLIRCCKEMQAGIGQDGKPACKHPENLFFTVADEDSEICGVAPPVNKNSDVFSGNEKFDCVVAMEVIEHLPHAEEAATKLEGLCREGGWTVFTVPSGHRERDELVTKNIPPVHVRSFDMHDLREIFGAKPEYGVISFSDLQEAAMDNSFSCWFMVAYKADHKPLGAIDYERKFFLQAPRQTMAVCMIAHNSEDVMHRCLRSVIKYADQVVIVDNGPSTDRTIEVAGEYTDDVRSGTNPFWCYNHGVIHPAEQIDPNTCNMAGFETPRNESTEGVWTDWICWIDCDEQMLEQGKMPKYLRQNIYTGYAIQQHHISIDAMAAMKRDVPVRLYRNIPGMKFYGVVHEHAELGINKGIGQSVMVISDVHIHHDGYLVESIRRNRFKRNLRLLQCDRKKYPDRLLGWFLYEIRDCQHMARYQMEQNGGVVDEQVAQMCNVTIAAYREKFMKENMMMSEDAMNYYSNALAMLGQGLEFSADIEVSKPGTNMPPQKTLLKFRAMDANEAMEMIKSKVSMSAAAHTGRYIQ